MSNHVPIVQVDAFTAEPFRGNPAAVCVLGESADASWMQRVAAEMNLSETAFVVRCDDGFSLRWFTPTTEVPLCGHATLASAHVLWEDQVVASAEPIRFHSQSGVLIAHREGDWIRLDFPAHAIVQQNPPPALADALGCQPLGVYRDRNDTYLVELDSAERVRRLQPNPRRLHELGCGACIVTAPSDSTDCDFVSRFFAPRFGIDEDPVTGSAHCNLAPFWAQRLGRTQLVGHQVSKRGGVVRVRVRGDRVDLLGQAVTVLRGELMT